MDTLHERMADLANEAPTGGAPSAGLSTCGHGTSGMRAVTGVALSLSFVLAACGSQPDGDREPPTVTAPAVIRHEPPADLSAAVSDTREDSVHPEFGDPLVDALHYELALAWTPESDHLEAIERLTFRATADAREIRLDFHDALTIDSLTVDGEDAEFRQAEKDLTIAHEVTADTQHLIELTYSGTPESYPGPYEVPDLRHWPRLGRHSRARDVHPAGARRLHVVRAQRPARRQGVLRLHAHRPRAVDRRRERRADRHH